jgi:nitrogen regulatory protein P-II 1
MAELSLIMSIVRKGWGDKVLEATCCAGVEGCTIMLGRGVGLHDKQKIMGITIEPEKEIVLTVIEQDHKDVILDAIVRSAELDKPGAGIALVIPVEQVVGVAHNPDGSCKMSD